MPTVIVTGRGIDAVVTVLSLLVLTVTLRVVGAAVLAAVAAARAAVICAWTSSSRSIHCFAVGGI